MVDLWPYSQRLDGAVTDLEHEALWMGATDYVVPGQPTTALAVGISGATWTVQPGRIHLAGHVLDVDTAQSGALPGGATSTRQTVVAAFIDRTQSPWAYGVRAVPGTPGGGRPALSKSETGVYEVALRAFETAPNGATTLLADERPTSLQALGAWTNLSLAGGYTTYDVTPQARLTYGGKRAEFRGTIRRNDSAPIAASGGPTLLTVPGVFRPSVSLQRFAGVATLTGVDMPGAVRLDVSSTGQMRLWTDLSPVWVGIFGAIWLD